MIKILLAFNLFIFGQGYCQSLFSGIVREAGSLQPVPFANVYFASTAIGAVTGEDGKFTFKGKGNGKYTLVVSFVGYATSKSMVIVKPDSNYFFDIKLGQKNAQLQSVIVRADTTTRKKYYNEFKKQFLGANENASSCTIKNPRDIHVYFEESENKLYAYARKPIVVENKALGYRLYFDLERFESQSSGTTYVWGVSRFEPLTCEKESERNQWVKTQEKTYQGSMTHFMRSLLANQFLEERWEVIIVYPQRIPPDRILKQKYQYYKDLDRKDSAAYIKYLLSRPLNSQMISMPLHGEELLSKTNDHVIEFQGTLEVKFKGEFATSYVSRAGGNQAGVRGSYTAPGSYVSNAQKSELYFINRNTQLYDNGYYEPQFNIETNGYLSTDRVSDFLPFDYEPLKKKKAKNDMDRPN